MTDAVIGAISDRLRRTGKPGAACAAPAVSAQGRRGRDGRDRDVHPARGVRALIAPYDPIATSWTLVRKPPSALHWFGTDDLGRDMLGRVIYGARASLVAGAISVGIALGSAFPSGCCRAIAAASSTP